MVQESPSILTNQAFHQSPVWSRAVTSICRDSETPDDLNPFIQAVRLLKSRKQFDVVLTMGPRPSLIYGICCGLLRLDSKQVLTEIFLDEDQPASLVWRIKTRLFRWVARRATGILTNSSPEIGFIADRFDIPEERLRYVPMHTTIDHPAICTCHDGPVLSIGRTLRDVATLLEAAPHFGRPLVMVLGRTDPLPPSIPETVRIKREIPLDQVHEDMRKASLMVIPLLPALRSTGQVVMLESMAMGTPVVATRAAGTVDYIRDGENGLLVEPGDATALAQAVRRLLENPDEADRLGKQALEDVQSLWLPDQHARHKLAAIRELWSPASPPSVF